MPRPALQRKTTRKDARWSRRPGTSWRRGRAPTPRRPPTRPAAAGPAKEPNAGGRGLVKEARDLVAATPVTDAQAASPEIAGAFTGAKEKGARQAELEQQWASFARDRYAQARAKAEEAQKLAR